MTERKRRGQNKPNRQATKDYRNNKKDSDSNKTIDTKNNMKKISEDEKQELSSLKREQATSTTSIVRNEFIPEVFGSSSIDVSSEMKDSAYIYEDDLKKAISTVQKKEPIKAEDLSLQPTSINPYLDSVNQITIIQERMSVLGGSSEWGSYYEIRRLDFGNPFMYSMTLWQSVMNNWIVLCRQFSENVANIMREYWMKSFWISHTINTR